MKINRFHQLVFILCVFLNVCLIGFHFAVILQEPQQKDFNTEFYDIFTEIGNSEQISFEVNFIQVNRERLDDSFRNCEFQLF